MPENDVCESFVFELLKLLPVVKHDALFFGSGPYDPQIILIVVPIKFEDEVDAKDILLPRLTYSRQIKAFVRA